MDGQSLRNLEFPSTGVTFSQSFLEISVAKDWGLTPEQFSERSKEDRLIMMAHYIASQKIESWLSDKAQAEADSKRRVDARRANR